MPRRLLSELLQTNRYRLLFFIYTHGKIRASGGVKSKLARVFGYQSDGHFYTDWNYLTSSGLVTEDSRWIRITRKGRREFLPIAILWLGALLSILYAAIFLEQYVLSLEGFSFAIPPILASVAFLLTMGITYLYVYYSFRPKTPKEADELL